MFLKISRFSIVHSALVTHFSALNMQYWLLKTDAESYSIDDLKRDGTTAWTGVRNYQVRNYMRDQMKVGDKGFFYHSSTAEPAIVGICEVASGPIAGRNSARSQGQPLRSQIYSGKSDLDVRGSKIRQAPETLRSRLQNFGRQKAWRKWEFSKKAPDFLSLR